MLRGGSKHWRRCHTKSQDSSFALAGGCGATCEEFARGGKGLAPCTERETEAQMLSGVQQHVGTSGIQTQSSSLTQSSGLTTGEAGRSRVQPGLRTWSSASLSLSSLQCPRARIPIPSRPVPPSPAADASLASPAQSPSSDSTREPATSQPDLPHTLAMKGPLLGGMFSRHVKRHPGVSHPTPSPLLGPPVPPHSSASLCPSPPPKDPLQPRPSGLVLALLLPHVLGTLCFPTPFSLRCFPLPSSALCTLHQPAFPPLQPPPQPLGPAPLPFPCLSQAVPARQLPLHSVLPALAASPR